jgi:hypothetical protein
MWYFLAGIALTIVALLVLRYAYAHAAVSESYNRSIAGLDLGPQQRIALRVLRIGVRTLSRLSERELENVYRMLAMFVDLREESEWARIMDEPEWVERTLQEFLVKVEHWTNPSDQMRRDLSQIP